MTTPKQLVLYHGSCTDGFGAAFAAWVSLGDKAEYQESHYGAVKTPDDFIKVHGDPYNRKVHVLDFSFPQPVMTWLTQHAAHVTWLDHHKTSFEAMHRPNMEKWAAHSQKMYWLLDNDRSGAALAWDHYVGLQRPMLIEAIDDRDRWVFNLQGSKGIHAYLQMAKPWTFEQWDWLARDAKYTDQVNEGNQILRVWDTQIADAAKASTLVTLTSKINPATGEARMKDHPSLQAYWTTTGLAVNANMHHSEIGHELAKQSGTFGLVWTHDPGTLFVRCSLRSIMPFDVSALAKEFGGGGHQTAAGCRIPIDTFTTLLNVKPKKD
jgi:oligoribonuclease NrnB/cAMP/cGMP phosphodiesterase (DHH superfamily)